MSHVAPEPPTESAVPPPTAPKPRFRDRVLGMKGVAAVALASVVLGGVGGAALGAISNGDGRFGGPGITMMPPGGDGNQMMPPGMQGQLPPGTQPQQQVQPDGSGDTSSS